MAKKLFLNVLYNVGIFVCIVVIYWSYTKANFPLLLTSVFVGALLVIFKIKLLKEIRNSQRNP